MHFDLTSAQLLNDAWRGDMVLAGLRFRFLSRVIFFCFCVSFACFYFDGSFWYDKQEDKTDSNGKVKESPRNRLNGEEFLEQNKSRMPTCAENAQRAGGGEAQNEADLFSWMAKKWKKKVRRSKKTIINNSSLHKMTTTLRTNLTRNNLILKSTTRLTSLTSKKSSTNSIASHSNEINRQNIGNKNTFNTSPLSLNNGILHSKDLAGTAEKENFGSFTTKHVRKRRESDTNPGSTERNSPTFNIKYNGEHRVTNDFSIIYRGQTYKYNEYRMTDDGLQILHKSDHYGRRKLYSALFTSQKRMMVLKQCSLSNHVFFWQDYVLYRNFTVFLKHTKQNFKWRDYGVIFGNLFICSSKISLSCDEFLTKVKLGDQYSIWQNFSLSYNKSMYNYREYRVNNGSLEMCRSSDSRIQSIWRAGNTFKQSATSQRCFIWPLGRWYAVDKRLTVYLPFNGQYLTRKGNHYSVFNKTVYICKNKLTKSNEFTREDLLMCNDSIRNIQYEDKYIVWNNLSILYRHKMYDYTDYRLLNDGIKICNSTDTFTQNSWKLRNEWVKNRQANRNCNITETKCCKSNIMGYESCILGKHFTVYLVPTGQYFKRNEYSLFKRHVCICKEKLLSATSEFTQEDLVMCNDSVINIQYKDKYIVWKNFSILYKDKMYDYTEYRALNDGIKICNSTDTFILNSWKLRNKWIKNRLAYKNCDYTNLYRLRHQDYIVLKDLRVRILISFMKLVIDKNDYSFFNDTILICGEKLWFHLLKYLRPYVIAILCTSALSSICLLLLLIIYCLLPELRTLPGMNLMSLSIAYLLWNIIMWPFAWLQIFDDEVKYPCALEKLAKTFTSYSILTNTAVNVHHLRKTFCGNILVKSNDNRVKSFLKYALFSWGVPFILTVVEFIIAKTGILRFSRDVQWCSKIYSSFAWDLIFTYVLEGALMLYSIVTFIFTAYRIRQKLKASSHIAERSNIIKKRQSFVLLLKLSTIVGLVKIPAKLLSISLDISENIQNFVIFIVVGLASLLSGVYIATAFVFTRKNYRLLRKKYFSAKDNAV